MTPQIKAILDRIKNETLFKRHPLYFAGGTALAWYLKHRISYDIDIISPQKLPVREIQTLMYGLGAAPLPDPNAAAFRINRGEDIENYKLGYTLNEVKVEWFYPNHPAKTAALEQASFQVYKDGLLRTLSLPDVATQKIFALFERGSSRDIFDALMIVESGTLGWGRIEELFAWWNRAPRTLDALLEGLTQPKIDETLNIPADRPYAKELTGKAQQHIYKKVKTLLLASFEKFRKDEFKNIKL